MSDLRRLYQPGEAVRLEFVKWDDRPHYWWDATVLEVRPDALLAGMQAGTVFHHVSRGFDLVLDHDGRLAYWQGRWYSGGPDLDPATGAVLEYYFNVGAPPEFLPGLVRVVDLELDVKVRPDHRCEHFDLEEFEEAASRYGYPAWVKRRVMAAAEEVRALVAAAAWPVLPPRPDARGGWMRREP